MAVSDQAPADPGDEAADDPLAITFDEDFVRGATVQEPSARARMLANRRQQDHSDALPDWPPPRTTLPAGGRRMRRVLAAVVVFAMIFAGYAAYCQRQVGAPQAPVPNIRPGSTGGNSGP